MEEPRSDQGTEPVDEEAKPRTGSFPFGQSAPPPRYTSRFAVEGNVSRIAAQIAEGRKPTYD